MSALSTTSSSGSATADHVFLAGRPPLPEFLGFISSQSVDHSQGDVRSLTDAWCRANDRVQSLEQSEHGIADGVSFGQLPSGVADLAAEVLGSDLVRRQYGVVPFEVAMIDLDRTVVFQKHVNLDHVRTIRERLGANPNEQEIFRLCLPLDDSRDDPYVHGVLAQQQPGASQFILTSASTDLRTHAPQLVDASEVPSVEASGVAAKFVLIPIGYSANFVSALAVNGRAILNNGSHRAYALREAGFTHAPALVQHVNRPDLLTIVANAEVVQRYDDFFVAPRPPLLKDYFEQQLRVKVRVERKARQITVVVQSSQIDVPAA
jgi:hypothetical protein